MSKKSADRSRTQRAQAALEERQRAERRRRMVVAGSIVAALVLVVVVVFVINSMRDITGETPAATPDGATADFGLVVGGDDAPTEVVIYEDPQCPNCALLEEEVGDDLAAAIDAGDIKVEYRIVSFLDRASTNDYSSRAANALVATYDVGGPDVFAKLHETLFAEQTPEGGAGHSDERLVGYAVEAGADDSEIRPLIEDGAYLQWIANATDAMSRNDVAGTPAVFVDGEFFDNSLEGIQSALD